MKTRRLVTHPEARAAENAAKTRTRRARRPGVEGLEGRALLAATITEVPSFPASHTDFGNNPSALMLRDGDLWFTARGSDRIGRLDPGSLTPTFSPTTSSKPLGMVLAPDQSLWYTTQDGNTIGQFVPATGQIVEYALPTPNSQPTGIAFGPDGNIWFTEQTANKIGRITPGGVITEFAVPTPNSNPYAIMVGPDGNLWFTSFNKSKIGRITPSGAITEFPTPTANSGPLGIAAGPDGKLWFTEFAADRIGRIDLATGAIVEFVLAEPPGTPPGVVTSGPHGIAAGPDGALYFTQAFSSEIGRITTGGVIREYATPSPNSRPVGIAVGPDGALWFTEFDTNKLGRMVYHPEPGDSAQADLTLSVLGAPAVGNIGETLTYTFRVINTGPDVATNVALSDPIPAGMTFLGGSASQGGVLASGGVALASLGDLAPGAVVTVSLSFRSDGSGTFLHNVGVQGNGAADNLSDNVARPATTVQSPPPPLPEGLRLMSVRWTDPITKRRGGTQLVLTFNKPLSAASARRKAFYRVVTAGRDKKLGTRDDRALGFNSAALDPSGQVVVLNFAARLNRRVGYRLIVTGGPPSGVTDAAGQLLDGDRNGTAGGNAVVDLVPGGTA